MIPVQGYDGRQVAVLGLGRSGLATARALAAGGATPIVWDDSPRGRDTAEAEGWIVRDLTAPGAFDGIAALIVSPGIPHLYPSPNPVIAAAWDAGVPVDNDIGLFFRSYATDDWDGVDAAPRVIAITGSNGKSTTSALIHHILEEAGRATQLVTEDGGAVLGPQPLGGQGVQHPLGAGIAPLGKIALIQRQPAAGPRGQQPEHSSSDFCHLPQQYGQKEAGYWVHLKEPYHKKAATESRT